MLDVDYSELRDMMAAHEIALPELSDAEAASEGRKMVAFLATELYCCGSKAS
ncbi:hypothetical protein ACRQ1B_23005 [Rhizobium panacihumi]|uniref:hypothetical protein n=1 Tax=Rhizobium panacihumi TaxID=2008450 RepID=UPI003D7A2B9E